MVWIAVAAAVLFSGCIGYVPPLSREPISGREITARDAGFIVPRKTTRAEVVRTLGRGYRESPLIPSMAYPWELPAGTGFWFIFSTHHAAGDTHQLTNWRALFLAFDARGVVSRKEIVRLKKGRSLDEQLEKWAGWVPPGLPRVNP
jgi:hypothetical protein